MNSEKPVQARKHRPIDWTAWSIWIILFAGIGIIGFFIYRRSSSQIEVWVPIKDLPAYHLIVDSDVVKTARVISDLPVEALSANVSPVGAFTIRSVAGDDVLSRGDIVLPASLQLTTNTAAISIPATEAMVFGGRLASGDIIMLWEVPNNSTTSAANLLSDQVLVLDVLPVLSAPTDNTEKFPYAVILAVPVDRQADILSSAARGSLVFTLRP